jgi:peptide/nickel transport system substrate-binding protein
MKRIVWAWFVISSVLLAALSQAEVRPHYGGTLHVAMRAAPSSLDPTEMAGSGDSFGGRGLVSLLFDTLVKMDDAGRAQPALAESWQSGRGNQHWEFRLRQGVKFQDGTLLTGEIAAASLREANPAWNVTADSNTVVIEMEVGDPEVLLELALPRNAIAKRDPQIVGTGPFTVVQWQPGKSMTLAANEDCWRGRPFLDSIEIEMGRSFRDQMNAFELRKADLVEVAPEQMHHMMQEGRALTSSARMELLALIFAKDASSAEERQLRQALGLSIERGSIRNVILQGTGEPAGGLLPSPITGYGYAFPTAVDLQKARQLRNEARSVPAWTLGYDGNDPLSRVLAERVALNAKDAGLSLRPTTGADVDVRLVRLRIASSDPWVALSELLARIGMPALKNKNGALEDLFAQEQSALAAERVIPLFHLPIVYASAPALKDCDVRLDGSWNLERAWVETSRP